MERCPSHWRVVAAAPLDGHPGSWIVMPIAILPRALLRRRAQQAGLRLSMTGVLEKLCQIQEINVYPSERTGQAGAQQVVLSNCDATREKLIEIQGLKSPKSAI